MSLPENLSSGTAFLHMLGNGVRLPAIPMPHVRSASVGVFLRVGSRDETRTTNGVSHVLEHMAFKGTATRSSREINIDAERLGADVNAFTSKDTTGYYMTGMAGHAGAGAELVDHARPLVVWQHRGAGPLAARARFQSCE